jgi:hypothetical protein
MTRNKSCALSVPTGTHIKPIYNFIASGGFILYKSGEINCLLVTREVAVRWEEFVGKFVFITFNKKFQLQ